MSEQLQSYAVLGLQHELDALQDELRRARVRELRLRTRIDVLNDRNERAEKRVETLVKLYRSKHSKIVRLRLALDERGPTPREQQLEHRIQQLTRTKDKHRLRANRYQLQAEMWKVRALQREGA